MAWAYNIVKEKYIISHNGKYIFLNITTPSYDEHQRIKIQYFLQSLSLHFFFTMSAQLIIIKFSPCFQFSAIYIYIYNIYIYIYIYKLVKSYVFLDLSIIIYTCQIKSCEGHLEKPFLLEK